MRINIYVQDDLAEEVKQIGGINVSALCQEALRDVVDRHVYAVRQKAIREAFNRLDDVDEQQLTQTGGNNDHTHRIGR